MILLLTNEMFVCMFGYIKFNLPQFTVEYLFELSYCFAPYGRNCSFI